MFTLLIIFFLLATVVSFLCSLWEAVLLSITPAYAQIQFQQGTALGRRLSEFKDNIDQPLAAILTLNTIAHTVGAIGVGNQAANIWGDANPLITGFVVPLVMTLGILLLSEIIPKTLGANSWRTLVPFTVRSLNLIIRALWPLVWLSQFITRALKKNKSQSVLSRSDFLAMTEIGEQHGVFDAGESAIIKNLLRFDKVTAKDVMTPRVIVKMAAEGTPLQKFYDDNPNLQFSRIPVFQDDHKDNVSGFILKDELLAELIAGHGEQPLATIKREISVIQESFPIPDLFNQLLSRREHITLVVDEFGGMAGIVTMEDVIETLLGFEIIDETDHTEDMQQLARKNWQRRAKSLGLIDDDDTELKSVD